MLDQAEQLFPERSQRHADPRRPARPQAALRRGAGDPRRHAAERATAGSAPTSCWKKAGCSTSSAATTRPSPPSRKASGCAREVSGLQYLDDQRATTDRAAARLLHRRPPGDPAARAQLRDDMPQPIFILGFPRSGTTLVEQTLSAHPHIAAGDELPLDQRDHRAMMPRCSNSPLTYPEALAELWMGDQREGLDESARLLPAEGAPDWASLRTGCGLVHRQDAAERDASRPDRADVSRGRR